MLRLLACIALLLPASAAPKELEYFGAIAYSPSTGAHGWAYDHPTREAAEKVALQNCRKNATDCRTIVWFKNACASLARGPKGYGSGWGSSMALADGEAMKVCSKHSPGCNVIRQVCTTRKSG